ncbi:hypothetical protein P7G68_09690 [Enterococcus faecalis]|uniref:hypothetical protein n=1 Tax=Enterococcus faecalis TaxID=1351 RepID=UPI00288D0EE5|nr:hypothetical protein [Enterococcus faecalis]MDT2060716.1 hypothetical protein [Enterococcus faecalis]
MLLQIDKFNKKELEGKEAAKLLVDYIGGVSGTSCDSDAVKVFNNSDPIVITFGKEQTTAINLPYYEDFKIVAVWLLNDEGKTLRKLI